MTNFNKKIYYTCEGEIQAVNMRQLWQCRQDRVNYMKICNICPRQCGVTRIGEATGFCKQNNEPVVARAGLHFWEEPVISGSKGSGTVFFSGCNLRCVFCQNYNISILGEGEKISVNRLRDIYDELIGKGAHNINLVTPTHFTEPILLSLSQPVTVPVIWNSNAYESVDSLRKLEGKVDIFLPDLKYFQADLSNRYSATKNYFATATAAIQEMFRQTGPFEIDDSGIMRKGVIIRHLVLPGQIENSCKIINWVAEHFAPGEVMFSLMHQYLPCGLVSKNKFPELNRTLGVDEYNQVEQVLFASGIEDGFLQEADSASSNFIPIFDGTGV